METEAKRTLYNMEVEDLSTVWLEVRHSRCYKTLPPLFTNGSVLPFEPRDTLDSSTVLMGM